MKRPLTDFEVSLADRFALLAVLGLATRGAMVHRTTHQTTAEDRHERGCDAREIYDMAYAMIRERRRRAKAAK